MLIWLLLVPLSLVTMGLCYILNPIVLLFCDEDGELHGFLHYFQTWDDSCNPRCAVMEMAPKCIRYDWDKHYVETSGVVTPELEGLGVTRCVAKCINNDFTTKEKIKRYLCRVYWLTRNCAYGFAFFVYGCNYIPNQLISKEKGKNIRFEYEKDGNWLTRNWTYKNSANIFGSVYFNIYLGWKMYAGDSDQNKMAMIANRIAFKLHEDY